MTIGSTKIMSIQTSRSHLTQNFFASSLQVAFGLMQSALLLTGLERSIQNTRALVGKIVGTASTARCTFCISFLGWLMDDTLTNSLAAVLQRLLKAS